MAEQNPLRFVVNGSLFHVQRISLEEVDLDIAKENWNSYGGCFQAIHNNALYVVVIPTILMFGNASADIQEAFIIPEGEGPHALHGKYRLSYIVGTSCWSSGWDRDCYE